MGVDYEAEIKAISTEKGGANTTSSASVELVVEEVHGLIAFANALLMQDSIPARKREMFDIGLERLNEALYRFTRDILLIEGNPNEILRRLGERGPAPDRDCGASSAGVGSNNLRARRPVGPLASTEAEGGRRPPEHAGSYIAPSRANKTAKTHYLLPAYWKTLEEISFRTRDSQGKRISQQQLVAEALNLLFIKYDLAAVQDVKA